MLFSVYPRTLLFSWAFVSFLNYKKAQVLAVYFLTVYFLGVSENETKFATKTQIVYINIDGEKLKL